MEKYRTIYCWECAEYTTQKYVGRKSYGEGYGWARLLVAVLSLGASEATETTYWKCEKCGHINEE